MVPDSKRSVLVLDTCFWLLQIQKIRPDDITNLLRAKNSLFNKFIEIGNLREAVLIANAILLSISQETSMDLKKKYKVLFESNLLIKKFKKILHSDRVRKANSLPRAKHTKMEQSICMNKMMIIIKINFWRTDKYNALKIDAQIFAKNGAVLNIWCFSSARIVSSMLDVDFLLFSRVERVSKQFHLPFWRVKNAKEPWMKFQANIYNVLKLKFENPFHGQKSRDIPLFQLRSFRWFDALS